MAHVQVRSPATPTLSGQPQSASSMIDGAPDLMCEQEVAESEPWTGYLDVEMAEWRNFVGWGGQSRPAHPRPPASGRRSWSSPIRTART